MARDDDHRETDADRNRGGRTTTRDPISEPEPPSDLHPVVDLDELVPPGPRLGPRLPREHTSPGPTSSQEIPVARLPEQVPVPVVRGRVVQRAREAIRSRHEADDLLLFEGRADSALTVERRDELAALALAAILLENLRRIGASRVSSDALGRVVGPLLKRLAARELMAVEIEAFNVLQSFGVALDPSLAEPAEPVEARPDGQRVEYDPEAANIELIRRSVRESFDLNILYYTGGRGELSRRRVTPRRIEAEKYLYAWCHSREAERVFRISRIAQAEPVGGRPVVTARVPVGSLAAPDPLAPTRPPGRDPRSSDVTRTRRARKGRDQGAGTVPLFAGLDADLAETPGAQTPEHRTRAVGEPSQRGSRPDPQPEDPQSSLFDDGES